MPGISGTVGHHTDGISIYLQPVPVRLYYDHFSSSVAEGPVQGRHRTKQGEIHDRYFILQQVCGLRDGGVQHVVYDIGRAESSASLG